MQNNNSKVISGVSIATTILAALALAVCIIAWLAIVLGGGIFNAYGPEWLEYGYGSAGHHGYGYHGVCSLTGGLLLSEYDPYYGDFDVDGIMDLGNLGLIIGGGVVLWIAAMCVVSLIGGILGIRNAKNGQKMGSVFGWNVAGAICALLSGRMITMVLQIITAVFSFREKNAYANAVAYGAPNGSAYPQSNGQPFGGQPYGAQPGTQQPYSGQPSAQPYAAGPAAQPYNAQPMAQQPYGQPAAQQPYGTQPSVQQPYQPAAQPVGQPYVTPTQEASVQPYKASAQGMAAQANEATPSVPDSIPEANTVPVSEVQGIVVEEEVGYTTVQDDTPRMPASTPTDTSKDESDTTRI